MILCIGTTPAAQRVMVFPQLDIGAVNRAGRTLDGAAGKSINVAKVLKALGEEPVAIGFLGGDRGEELRRILESRGIEIEFVHVRARTRQCITVIDDSGGTQTELVEEGQAVSAEEYAALVEVVRRRILTAKAAVMSGTLASGVPDDFYMECIRSAKNMGALSVVDAKGFPRINALKARPGLVKPNRAELAATVGRELTEDADVMTGLRELHERGAERVIVTAGAGATLAYDGNRSYRVHTPVVPVKNPIGSGDAFTAAVVARLLRGDDLGEACRWGSAAGAANALTLMPGELEKHEVERLLARITKEQL